MKSYRIKLNFILREFEDGGFQLDDNFCHLQNLNAVEFDRLASHSSIVGKMTEIIKQIVDEDFKSDDIALLTPCHMILAEIDELLKD